MALSPLLHGAHQCLWASDLSSQAKQTKGRGFRQPWKLARHSIQEYQSYKTTKQRKCDVTGGESWKYFEIMIVISVKHCSKVYPTNCETWPPSEIETDVARCRAVDTVIDQLPQRKKDKLSFLTVFISFFSYSPYRLIIYPLPLVLPKVAVRLLALLPRIRMTPVHIRAQWLD